MCDSVDGFWTVEFSVYIRFDWSWMIHFYTLALYKSDLGYQTAKITEAIWCTSAYFRACSIGKDRDPDLRSVGSFRVNWTLYFGPWLLPCWRSNRMALTSHLKGWKSYSSHTSYKKSANSISIHVCVPQCVQKWSSPAIYAQRSHSEPLDPANPAPRGGLTGSKSEGSISGFDQSKGCESSGSGGSGSRSYQSNMPSV